MNYRHNYNDGKVDTFQISNPNALIDLYLSQILFLKHFPETPFCTLDGQGCVFKSAMLSANHSASQRSPTKLSPRVYDDKIVDEIAFASSAMIAFAMIAVIALFWANSSRWPVAYFNQKYLPQHYQLDAHKYTHFTI